MHTRQQVYDCGLAVDGRIEIKFPGGGAGSPARDRQEGGRVWKSSLEEDKVQKPRVQSTNHKVV